MLKELSIIETIASILPNPEVLTDDAFVEEETGRIYTTDLLVEGQHFHQDYVTPADLGWKAGAVNISDIAAMGGEPRFLLVSLGLPEQLNTAFVQEFYQSLQALANTYHCQIVGGDTVGSPQLVVNVTAIGQLPTSHTAGRRSQAKPGDWIITTGYSGLSAAGLVALQKQLPDLETCKQAHLRPRPRIVEGLLLSKSFSRYSLMDTSDGLADALIKMAQQSQARLEVVASQIPLHPELKTFSCKAGQVPLQLALYGGEDFELVATVPTVDDALLAHFTVIGRVTAGTPEAVLVDEAGNTLETLSLEKTFHHFQEALA